MCLSHEIGKLDMGPLTKDTYQLSSSCHLRYMKIYNEVFVPNKWTKEHTDRCINDEQYSPPPSLYGYYYNNGT